jgi:superfamily II DNA or RNA helicase
MPKRTSKTGSELFIVDNSDDDWKVLRYLHEWCGLSKAIDIATAYFEIGSLLALCDEWAKVDAIRILLGDEVSKRTHAAFVEGLKKIETRLNDSLEAEKEKNDFLRGVPAIVDAIRAKKIQCKVYRQDKFHAKCYLTHARQEVVGSFALVGSSNFTYPGITENIELNVQIGGTPVAVLQEWYEQHWNDAEDVTADILRVIERHVREYSPFEVYAKALQELFQSAAPSEQVWEQTQSRMFHVLDGYQRDGYHNLLRIANEFGGALLCDGVGLGKTYVGLMLIERLIVRDGRNVILLAPKAAVDSVWKPALKRYLKKLSGGAFSNLFVASHSDLGLKSTRELFEAARERAHAIVIDEAHHFRNLGAAGTGLRFLESAQKQQQPFLFTEEKRSRYRELFDLVRSPSGTNKQLFLLTATPINNSFHDLRHVIELFTQRKEDHFAQRLGIHSVTAHFKQMEKRLDRAAGEATLTNSAEAKEIMAADPLVGALVVQRSRSFVKEKQMKAGTPLTAFPPRRPPQRAEYALKKVYGKLLETLERAFDKRTPLFTLPMYYPLAYYTGPSKEIDPGEENRQAAVVALIRTGFLKRFESSVEAFRASCERLLVKLLGWIVVHAETSEEKQTLADWRQTHIKLIEQVRDNQPHLFGTENGEPDDEADDDLFEEEWLESIAHLNRENYDVARMLTEALDDLDQLVEFFAELDKFDHRNDDKLKKLLKLLKDDPVLRASKLLLFSEFADTADYLYERLTAAGIEGVERIDSRVAGKERLAIIRRFSPYYNHASSAELKAAGHSEIRVLISTDVLAEGLNLQDASRLINYDLHWNPVRLMQRIGRVDRRRNPDTEERIAADHPESIAARQEIVFYNFLPPAELNDLLTLYSKVTRKTLRISKALGIEGKKLLTEDDDYQDLQHFNESYEGTPTAMERLELERDDLLATDPALRQQLESMPLRVFSGKEQPKAGSKGVFFCYRIPAVVSAAEANASAPEAAGQAAADGETRWYLYDLSAPKILEEPTAIVDWIRCSPPTPRRCAMEQATLAEIRTAVERHIKNTYLKSLNAPVRLKPLLKCWMELS